MRLFRPLVFVLFAVAALAGCQEDPALLSATSTGDLSLGKLPRQTFDVRQTAACGPGGTTPAGDAGLMRMPYLQQVTSKSAQVLWTTDATAACRVRLRGPDGVEREVAAEVDASASPKGARQLVARLDGLEPATAYCYELVCGDEPWVAPTGFLTAPSPGPSAEPVRFAVLGDLGEASSAQHAVAAAMADTEFDFALVTGDIAYPSGSLASFEKHFFDVYAELLDEVPFFVASGNHDRNKGQGSPYSQVFSLFENGGPSGKELWYSFDWGPVHVAVLDTERVNATQAAWLDADLARSDAPWKLVMGHRPPYSAGEHGDSRRIQRTFEPILQKHDVPLALWGHDHNYERTRSVGGVTHVVTGGGGKSSRSVRPTKRTAFADPTSHFVHVTIEGDELRAYAIDAGGEEFDTFVLHRRGAPAVAERP